MKKRVLILCLIALALVFYGAYKYFIPILCSSKTDALLTQKLLFTPHPVLEDQKIIAIVLAENVETIIEHNLRSFSDQTYAQMHVIYIDICSEDHTSTKVQEWIEKEKKNDHITLIKLTEETSVLEMLYKIIGSCQPNEIIALIDGKDWLVHENVFKQINYAYANPDVWMTYSRFISHPDYKNIGDTSLLSNALQKKECRKAIQEEPLPFITFYAGLFHEIKLQDLMYKGQFVNEHINLAIQFPLIEMGMNHILFMDEVLYVKNHTHLDYQPSIKNTTPTESYLRSLPTYPRLSTYKHKPLSPSSHHYNSDLILFSEDSPLHLYACLESLFLNVHDINDIYVLYKSSDHKFQRSYLNLQKEFRTLHFFNLHHYPNQELSSLLTQILTNQHHASPYIMIGKDHMIFQENISLHDCIQALEKTHVDQFFLHTQESPSTAVDVAPSIFAIQLNHQDSFPDLFPSLCRKTLLHSLNNVNDISSFKQFWKHKLQSESVALFFKENRLLPPLEDISPIQKQEWNQKFIEGFKIDLLALPYEQTIKESDLPLIQRNNQGLGRTKG